MTGCPGGAVDSWTMSTKEESPGTSIVPIGAPDSDRLPTAEDFANARCALDELVERGDAKSIFEGSTTARAAQLFHERNGHKQIANQFARLKILAEAGLGILDRRINPNLSWKPKVDRDIGGVVVSHAVARQWRVFAIAQIREMLDDTLDELEANPDETLSSTNVFLVLCGKGVMWAPIEPVGEAFDRCGWSKSELARRAGVNHNAINHHLDRPSRRDKYILWETAARLYEALGCDPVDLPPDLRPARRRNQNIRVAQKRHRLAHKALQDQERQRAAKRAAWKARGAIKDLYAATEKMQDTLGQAHGEATDREAREALSLAGEHYRKMRDEIYRALAVST